MIDARDEIVRTILDVAELAERAINRPSHGNAAAIAVLATRVDKVRSALIEGGNPVGVEVDMLLDAAGEIDNSRGDPERVTRWRMVAGVLLPMVRDCGVRALELRARLPSATDHDYRKPRQ